MAYENEVPSDGDVCDILQRGPSTARDLVDQLVAQDHTRRDSQRAIQRCLDRGYVRLGSDLKIELVREEALAA